MHGYRWYVMYFCSFIKYIISRFTFSIRAFLNILGMPLTSQYSMHAIYFFCKSRVQHTHCDRQLAWHCVMCNLWSFSIYCNFRFVENLLPKIIMKVIFFFSSHLQFVFDSIAACVLTVKLWSLQSEKTKELSWEFCFFFFSST